MQKMREIQGGHQVMEYFIPPDFDSGFTLVQIRICVIYLSLSKCFIGFFKKCSMFALALHKFKMTSSVVSGCLRVPITFPWCPPRSPWMQPRSSRNPSSCRPCLGTGAASCMCHTSWWSPGRSWTGPCPASPSRRTCRRCHPWRPGVNYKIESD